jgi:RimJ/RimL family protein N-acetyltransferase
MTRVNEYGQPIGADLGPWKPPEPPRPLTLLGRTVTVIPLVPERDAIDLYDALSGAPHSIWTYMTFGPFTQPEALGDVLRGMADDPAWLPYVFEVEGRKLGFASYLRIQPRDGVMEIGAITLATDLQRTTAATEGLYLMIRNVFDQGYRRCEWKCDDLNQPSRDAADRLGFTYEGTFSQATHYKGRNRDTAWYAITDREWPALDTGFKAWLDPSNFDDEGRQLTNLREMRQR